MATCQLWTVDLGTFRQERSGPDGPLRDTLLLQGRFAASTPPFFKALVFAPVLLLIALAAACASPEPLSGEFSTDVVIGPAPLTVRFSPAEDAEGTEFQWEFGDGSASSERSPSHTYFDAGEFKVRLTVKVENRSAAGDSNVTVQPGPAGWIVLEPSTVELKNGETQAFTVSAYDENGNPVPEPEITWKVAPAVGTIDENGVLSASGPEGEYEAAVEAEFERLGKTVTANASVNLALGPLASVEIVNDEFSISVGRSVQLDAVAKDVSGNVIEDVNFDWETIRSEDRITGEGLFTAGTIVSHGADALVRLVASHEEEELTAEVTGAVGAGIIDRIAVTPANVTVELEGSVQLETQAFDRFGNVITPDLVEWVFDDEELGNVDRTGTFTAGTQAGKLPDDALIVEAEKDGVKSITKVPVVIEPGPAVVLRVGPDGDSVPSGASLPLLVYVADGHGNRIEDAPVDWSTTGGGSVTDRGVFIAGFDTGDFPDAIRAALAPDAAGNAAELTATMSISVRQRSSDLLAFEVQDLDGGTIYLLDLQDASLRELSEAFLENGAKETGPTWTPDGSLLLYTSNLTGVDQVYAIDPSSGEVAQLTNDPDGAGMASVSPSGDEFAYVALTGDAWQVYTADFPHSAVPAISPVTREAAKRISNDDSIRYVLPHWSPDGQTLAMTTIQSDGSTAVVTVGRDGDNEQPLLGNEGDELAFGWIKDGSGLLLGVATSDSTLELFTAELPGDHRHEALELPFSVKEAYWSPDQSEVVLVDSEEGGLWLTDSDGTGLRQVIRAEASPGGSAWRPIPIGPAS